MFGFYSIPTPAKTLGPLRHIVRLLFKLNIEKKASWSSQAVANFAASLA